MKYTQGEWSFDPNESEFSDKHYIFCPAGKTICSIFGSHDDPEDEANGNALLIAAAPELLEALKSFVVLYKQGQLVIEGDDGNDPVVAKAVTAIAKATGEKKGAENNEI